MSYNTLDIQNGIFEIKKITIYINICFKYISNLIIITIDYSLEFLNSAEMYIN